MTTYPDSSPSSVRTGDTVTDKDGHTFTAWRDALWVEETRMWNIVESGTLRHRDYDSAAKLTVSYDETAWAEENYE